MIDTEKLIQGKEILEEYAEELTSKEIGDLVDLLEEKNDEVRYAAFLALQKRSQEHNDVYPYWQVFADKQKQRK